LGNYLVEHINNAGTITDITAFVHSIDEVKMYSDGRISTASLTLQANFGFFMTNTNGGLTPLLSNFDRIRLTATDPQSDSQSHIFQIINDLGQLTRMSEYLLPLTLEGRERALALMPFSGYYDALNHHAMVELILKTYAFTKIPGALQPIIVSEDDTPTETNLLPKYNPNIWDFQYIDNCLDAIKAVVRLANQSVAAGGGGDRFAIFFEDSTVTPLTLMSIHIISQGANNIPSARPTIRANQIANPIISIPRVKQPITGSVVVARGRPGSGGVLVDGDVYRAKQEFFQRIRDRQIWNASITYPIDAYASLGGVVYQAVAETTGDKPPHGNWFTIQEGAFIGDIQYSGFTKDKASIYKNECTNPQMAFASETEASPKMLDCNLVIDDVETQRDFVLLRKSTDVVASFTANEKKYLWNETDFYDGFRMLIDTAVTPAGTFAAGTDSYGAGAGNDPNGVPFADNAVIYAKDSNGDLKWFVMRAHEQYDQIVVRFEGLFEWNVNFATKSRYAASDTDNANRRKRQAGAGGTFAWRALGEQFLANDCLHSPSSIVNSTGLIPVVANTFGGGNYTDNSAIKIIYEYGSKTDMPEWLDILEKVAAIGISALGFLGFLISASAGLADLFFTPYYRNMGWWITISAPFPLNTHNTISEKVGELYGGSTIDELNDHSTFDAFNQTATFKGDIGWNETNSNEFMEITGVTFLFRLNIHNNGTPIPFYGDIPCSWWAIDTNGTIWKSKKKYRLLGDIQRMTFDFGDFSPVYRGRTPFGINNIITNILTPELEIRERLFANRIVLQGFQLEAGYDEHGRYMPNLWETVIKPSIMTMFDPTTVTNNVEFIGEFDYLQWVKTPIAIAKQSSPDWIIFPEIKDYPQISNIEQLQRAADADLDVEQFQYEQYEITRNNIALPNMQDTVYLFEKNMINEAEAPRISGAAWNSGTTYAVDDIVDNAAVTYICIKINTNQAPPNSEFWLAQTDPVANTRELTVAEISWAVTEGKDVEFTHTLVRRIPKV
jgi:preprotein translocase subunit Sss1